MKRVVRVPSYDTRVNVFLENHIDVPERFCQDLVRMTFCEGGGDLWRSFECIVLSTVKLRM